MAPRLSAFLAKVIKATDQKKGLFGYVIEIALAQAVERFNGPHFTQDSPEPSSR